MDFNVGRRVLVPYREARKVGPYRDAVLAAGLEPVLVDNYATLGDAGGLLLTGGTDVDPARYGEARQPETEDPDTERDELEFSLLEEALARDLPVFAICRGMQLLNVCHGGTLIQHLDTTERHGGTHPVSIEPGTILSSIATGESWQVNSRHHQAVKTVGRDLRVSAFDPEDGTIEALERPDKRFVLAVQWHPEDLTRDAGQQNLFRRFADAVNGDE